MNYKVMNRPMFKMGGSTTPRENFAEKGYTDFLKSAQEKYAKQQEALKNMGGVQTFKNLSRLTPFLQQDTNNPLKFLSNIVSDPELLGSVVLPGMTEQKKAELLANDPKTDLAFAKAMKPQGAFGEKVYQTKKRDLAQINKKIKAIREGQVEGHIDELEEQKILIFSGFETDAKIRAQISDAYYEENQTFPNKDYVDRELAKRKASLGKAEGGRVNRQMGTPMMGEQPMQPETQMSEQSMQPEGQQDPYQYLRTRLPAEIPDQVVKLIAYNKEAFNDFAAIETQDDLDSFNKRYNVELVVNV